jgi:hypothetical protein
LGYIIEARVRDEPERNKGREQMNRKEAVKEVGENAVAAIDGESCDYSISNLDNGLVEFTAFYDCKNKDGEDVLLIAYFYQTEEDESDAESLDEMEWEIDHYEVVDA